jgi:hypothetical protein
MKPINAALPLAVWLLRISTVLLIVQLNLHEIEGWEFTHPAFILAAILISGGFLLFIGGFMSNPWLTIISGLFLFGLSIYKLVLINHQSIHPSSSVYLMLAAVSLFFVTNGNS